MADLHAHDEYKLLLSSNSNYYLASRLQRLLKEEPRIIAMTLLRATWEAGAVARYTPYATEALEAFEHLLGQAQSDPKQWPSYQLIAGELERRLGRFEAAKLRFDALALRDEFKDGVYRDIVELQQKLIEARDTTSHRVPQKQKTP